MAASQENVVLGIWIPQVFCGQAATSAYSPHSGQHSGLLQGPEDWRFGLQGHWVTGACAVSWRWWNLDVWSMLFQDHLLYCPMDCSQWGVPHGARSYHETETKKLVNYITLYIEVLREPRKAWWWRLSLPWSWLLTKWEPGVFESSEESSAELLGTPSQLKQWALKKKKKKREKWSVSWVAGQFGFLKDWKLGVLGARAKETSGDGQESSQGATHLHGACPIHHPLLIVPLAVLKDEIAKPCLSSLLPHFLEYSTGAFPTCPQNQLRDLWWLEFRSTMFLRAENYKGQLGEPLCVAPKYGGSGNKGRWFMCTSFQGQLWCKPGEEHGH